jgi:hypothetical protein
MALKTAASIPITEAEKRESIRKGTADLRAWRARNFCPCGKDGKRTGDKVIPAACADHWPRLVG